MAVVFAAGLSVGQQPLHARRDREAADESVAGIPTKRTQAAPAATPETAKLTIKLTPLSKDVRAAMLAANHVPSLELICRPVIALLRLPGKAGVWLEVAADCNMCGAGLKRR